MNFFTFPARNPQKDYKQLVRKLPTQASIYLPTDKLSIEQKIDGVRKVCELYKTDLENIYRPKLRALRKQYQNHRRCFLIGNGPSINKTDLSLLKNEVTFAVNSFFLKYEDLDWSPTFYVVEDHLVAEDRAPWINQLNGSIKLFPVYLAYCLNDDNNTIFFNHQPRKSYPHSFDFSTNASEITYTGCTVIFTCMQIAYYLGFREIYLIGVDANYELPQDVVTDDIYGTCVLDMKSNDPNHFHPDYFGKGFRWHDPQVNKMIEAFEMARRVCDKSYKRIYNATIGGKLEVFERKDYYSLFSSSDHMNQVIKHPRLLMIDSTPVGQLSATGQLKKTFLGQWPNDAFLQFWAIGGKHPSLFSMDLKTSVDDSRKKNICLDTAVKMAVQFNPEVIYFRPVDSPLLFDLIEIILMHMQRPLVVHVMDDWMERMKYTDAAQHTIFDRRLRKIIEISQVRLSISDAMSKVFAKRYGKDWHALANGVDTSEFIPRNWLSRPQLSAEHPFRIRYMGGLADDMSFESVRDFAKAVDALQDRFPVEFEIRTMEWYLKKATEELGKYRGVYVADLLKPEDYIPFLCQSDALLIAYNFDKKSLAYTSLSLANKMPECLASGAILIAYGPPGTATISYLKNAGCAIVIEKKGENEIMAILQKVLSDVSSYTTLGKKGIKWVEKHLTKPTVQENFRQFHINAKASYSPPYEFAPDPMNTRKKRKQCFFKDILHKLISFAQKLLHKCKKLTKRIINR